MIFPDSQKLILGSFPSVTSREGGFYYLHPQNRFWRVLSELFDVDFVGANRNEKITLLKQQRIALSDVVRSGRIDGSADHSIRQIQASDIPSLIKGTQIDRFYLNGNKAYELFLHNFPEYHDKAVKLPSTSPANAAWKLHDLVEAWQVIRS